MSFRAVQPIRETRSGVGGTLTVGFLVTGAVVVTGFLARDRLHLTAEFGLGYALGVIGLGMMSVMLVYSIRKRMRALSRLGGIRHWLRIHMLLGVVGPLAILFHASFQMGSLNSTVALVCMLLVASSGVVGRLIYPRIHEVLSGRRSDVGRIRSEAASQRGALGQLLAQDSDASRELAAFESVALATTANPAAAIWQLVVLRARVGGVKRRVCEALARGGHTSERESVVAYLDVVRSAGEFAGFERLFSLWHAFHLPFCIMLFISAAVHVVAVHMY